MTTQDNLPPIPDGYEKFQSFPGFNKHIGPLYYRETEAEFRRAFRVDERHVNGMGICHGGMLMTLADLAFGHAISWKYNRYWVTVRLLTDFIASAQLGDWVEGSSEIVGQNGDFFITKGRIWAGEKTLMTGTGTFKMMGERPPR
ncbi:MAG: PaaI family thioesterase [Alphaproteobacteria bacterium]